MAATATIALDPVAGHPSERIRARLLRPLPADGWMGWGLPLLITAVAAALRFISLGRPNSLVFDETYYVHDSASLLHHGVELDANSHDHAAGFVVHPPLGKWMLAVGQALFGNTSFGWRFSAAVIGSLAVLLLARIGRRLFRSTALGCIAAVLLTFDGLEFVQSRIAMLDIFLMFWVLAAFGCLLLDRDQGRRRLVTLLDRGTSMAGLGPSLGARPWRWACGFCLGAAMATKWDGIFWVPLFLLLAVWWDAGARRLAGVESPWPAAIVRDGLLALLPLVLLPALVYVASWTGWFVSDGAHAWDHDRYVHHGQSWLGHDVAVLGGWWRYQWEIWNFHAHLDAAHPYLSRPWGWLLLARPVAYYYQSPGGRSQEVLGIGTPAIWWLTIPALVAVGWRMLGRRDWRAAAILLSFLAGYLPWFYEDIDHRTMFLFYLLPDVPFMCLALAMGLGMVLGSRAAKEWRRIVGATVTGAYLVLVVANFAYFYPVLAAQTISYQQWHDRMWLRTCDPAQHRNEHHENAPCWI